MSRGKKTSKRKSRACAVPLLGAAGLSLSMVSGSPAATVGPTAHEITLGEEEISDVSLATFYVFDKENVGASEPGVQLVGHRGCHGTPTEAAEAATEAAEAVIEAAAAEVAEAAEAALRFGGVAAAVEAAGGGAIE